jgi:3,4-dihydroxy 2-butanone 4-phosphate synthase/GTP cyclohydrolase II
VERSLKSISTRGIGAIIYMNQEPGGNNILNRFLTFKSKTEGSGTSFSKDTRDFGVGAQIIRFLGIKNIDLLTNNPIKRIGVHGYGLHIAQNSPLD